MIETKVIEGGLEQVKSVSSSFSVSSNDPWLVSVIRILEMSMLVEMIQTNSASLFMDLVIINRKLASYPWLRKRGDIRNKLLQRLRVVEMKGEGEDPGEGP